MRPRAPGAMLWLVIALATAAYAVRLDAPSWQSSGQAAPRYVFDESYTAFTAHRLLQGDPSILVPAVRRYRCVQPDTADLSPLSRGEWSHPPGAPLAIASTIAVFGFNATGARMASVLAALITLVATAYLAGPRRAWLACVLVGFDGAFFVFARVAMPHMLLTAGVTAGAALMVSAVASPVARRRWALTAAAGLALGFAASVRWTAIPVAVALGLATQISVEGSRRRMLAPLAAALAAAAGAYLATYLPWFFQGHGLADLVQLHRAMLAFHAAMPGEAAQSQPAYAWPWTLRAVTFVVETARDEVRAVLCTGGRILWWSIAPVLVVGAWRARRRGLRWLLPTAAIAATWAPWAVLGRFGMTYYLLPALPFAAVLAAGLVAHLRVRCAAAICAALVLALFVISYPVLAAVPISRATFARYTAVLGR